MPKTTVTNKIINYLYTHSGLSKDDVYQAMRLSMDKYPSRRIVRELLEDKVRFTSETKYTYSDKKRDLKKIMSPEFYESQMKDLKKNYVKNAIMKTEVSPKRFNKEIRTSIANIFQTDES